MIYRTAEFLRQLPEFRLDVHAPRWRARAELPATHPNSFHVALLSAMSLAVCATRDDVCPNFVEFFRERTRAQMEIALSLVDRLEDWLYASIILTWFFMKKRLMLAVSDLLHATALRRLALTICIVLDL